RGDPLPDPRMGRGPGGATAGEGAPRRRRTPAVLLRRPRTARPLPPDRRRNPGPTRRSVIRTHTPTPTRTGDHPCLRRTHMRTNHTTRTVVAAAAALALGLGLAACSEDTGSATSNTAEPAATSQPNDGGESEAAVVVFQNGWAKATDTDMSGAFGTLRNTGDVDVRITGVSSPISEVVEMHEMVPGGSGMQMQEKEGGFVIPAGGELFLEPGKEHFMFMDLT